MALFNNNSDRNIVEWLIDRPDKEFLYLQSSTIKLREAETYRLLHDRVLSGITHFERGLLAEIVGDREAMTESFLQARDAFRQADSLSVQLEETVAREVIVASRRSPHATIRARERALTKLDFEPYYRELIEDRFPKCSDAWSRSAKALNGGGYAAGQKMRAGLVHIIRGEIKMINDLCRTKEPQLKKKGLNRLVKEGKNNLRTYIQRAMLLLSDYVVATQILTMMAQQGTYEVLSSRRTRGRKSH